MNDLDVWMIGGPKDGQKIRCSVSTSEIIVPNFQPPEEISASRTVYRFHKYRFLTKEMIALIDENREPADAFWDLVGLEWAGPIEKELPEWLSQNRRRLAGQLLVAFIEFAEDIGLLIVDTALALGFSAPFW